MGKMAEHQRLLFEIGRLIKALETGLGNWRVHPECDFAKPFLKLTPMINAAMSRGLFRKYPKLEHYVMTVMCWVSDSEWISELIPPIDQSPIQMGYTFAAPLVYKGDAPEDYDGKNINMFTDGELLSVAEYAKKYNAPAVTVKQRAAAGMFMTARKLGERWVIDGDEPYV